MVKDLRKISFRFCLTFIWGGCVYDLLGAGLGSAQASEVRLGVPWGCLCFLESYQFGFI